MADIFSWAVRPGTTADSPQLFRVSRRTAFDLRLRLGQVQSEEAPDKATLEKEWEQIRPLYDHLTDLVFRRMEATAKEAQIVDRLDQAVLGYRRRPEHNWFMQNRRGYLYYRHGEAVAYGYEGKQSGPFVLLDNGDFPAALAHAETAVVRQGHPDIEFVTPTVNEAAVDHLLAHGYRLKPFFCQLMTSRPFGRFDHYVATSPMFSL